jgi:hypothetical protein
LATRHIILITTQEYPTAAARPGADLDGRSWLGIVIPAFGRAATPVAPVLGLWSGICGACIA